MSNDTSNATGANGTSNATGANGTGNGTISESMIHKWYKDWQSGNPDPGIGVSGIIPLPALQVTPTVSSSSPNSLKILMIGMSPNTLKVGDKPMFTLTYQNISDKPIYVTYGCSVTPLGLVISPSDNALMMIGGGNRAGCPDGTYTIDPNSIVTNWAMADPTLGHVDLNTFLYSGFSAGLYQITKPGKLHVTMELFVRNHGQTGKYDIMETVQFDVNATQ